MTNEEIQELKGLAASIGLYDDKNPCKRAVVLGKAIKILEQELCEDAISRADVKKYLSAPDANGDRVIYESDLDLLSPVRPKPKTGHWIYDDEHSTWSNETYKCSCCKRAIIVPYEAREAVYKDYPYCHCGAKMIEPQESKE